jgi:hypothetical protein
MEKFVIETLVLAAILFSPGIIWFIVLRVKEIKKKRLSL